MVSFIDAHRATYGVESICAQLPIAPSQYYEHKAREAEPARLPPRLQRDRALAPEIRRGYEENFHVYGFRKVWRQLGREDFVVARCTVERLMRSLGLQGAVSGRKCRTTVADDSAERPLDRVKRQFQASRPNQLWVGDFTYVATWTGFVYVAFVIEVFTRRIIGWRVASPCIPSSCWMRSSRRCGRVLESKVSCITATAAANTCRFATPNGSRKRGAEPSVGSVGDTYDNALAETIIGLYKTEVSGSGGIRHVGMGRLVQPSSFARTYRQHSAGRARNVVLSFNESVADGGLTQARSSPEKPGRFTSSRSVGRRPHGAAAPYALHLSTFQSKYESNGMVFECFSGG
jgi:putative transposase